MKRVLSIAAITLLFAGCGNEKSETKVHTQSVTPIKTTAVKKVLEEKKVVTTHESVPQENNAEKVAVKAVDGAQIFKHCASCHGVKGEKKALGKSQVIAGWDSVKVVTALKGYTKGTYGGSMKAVMKGQASKLSDDDMKAVADYISTLK